MNFNKVFLLGRLTADPQLRSTPSGQQVVTLGVATNRVWKDKNGQKQEATEFHNAVIWGRQAEVVGQYLNKGSLIFIEGRLQTRNWEDKTGQPRKTTEIIAERIQLGPKFANSNQRTQQPSNEKTIPIIDINEEIKNEEIKEGDL